MSFNLEGKVINPIWPHAVDKENANNIYHEAVILNSKTKEAGISFNEAFLDDLVPMLTSYGRPGINILYKEIDNEGVGYGANLVTNWNGSIFIGSMGFSSMEVRDNAAAGNDSYFHLWITDDDYEDEWYKLILNIYEIFGNKSKVYNGANLIGLTAEDIYNGAIDDLVPVNTEDLTWSISPIPSDGFTESNIGWVTRRRTFTLNPNNYSNKVVSNENSMIAVLKSGVNFSMHQIAPLKFTFAGGIADPHLSTSALINKVEFRHYRDGVHLDEGTGTITWTINRGWIGEFDGTVLDGDEIHIYFPLESRDIPSWVIIDESFSVEIQSPKAISLVDDEFGHVELPDAIGRTSDWSGGTQRAYIVGQADDEIRWEGLKDAVGNKITITNAKEHHNGTYTILSINDSNLSGASIIYDLNPSSHLPTGAVTEPDCRFKIHDINQRKPLSGFA